MKTFSLACMVAAVSAAGSYTYNYKQQGADWNTVVPLCGTGKQQSPINLPAGGDMSLETNDNLKIKGENYSNYLVQQLNYGSHTLLVNAAAGDYFYTDPQDTTYPFKLAQFHMHAPSEHTHNGKHYDLEMHFVHLINPDAIKSDNGHRLLAEESSNSGADYAGVADFAVIGVFFDRQAGGNQDNSFITSLNAQSSVSDGSVKSINNVNVEDFLGSLDMTQGYYTYDGSFTTPPCTEGVKWVVVNEVQPISDAQLQQYTRRWAGNNNYANGFGNNRIVQSLNDRKLYFSGAEALQYAAATLLVASQLF